MVKPELLPWGTSQYSHALQKSLKNDSGTWVFDGRSGLLKQLAQLEGLLLGEWNHELTAVSPRLYYGVPRKLEGAQMIKVLQELQSK